MTTIVEVIDLQNINIYEPECPICLEEMGRNIKVLICKHTFHEECIDRWSSYDMVAGQCPICRKTYLNFPVVITQETHTSLRKNRIINILCFCGVVCTLPIVYLTLHLLFTKLNLYK